MIGPLPLAGDDDLFARPEGAADTVSGECPQHGGYTVGSMWLTGKLRNEDPTCPQCSTLATEAGERAERREQDERRARLREKRILRIGIPARVLSAKPFDPPTPRAVANLAAIKAYAEAFEEHMGTGASLILCGRPGTGKTHLACRMALSLSDRGASVLYATATAMMRYVRGAYGKTAEYTELQAINRFAGVDLLVLDELGVKLASDHDRATLFEIIDERYQEQRPTVVISNLSLGELASATDERMIDRLRHSGTALVFDWDSYRGSSS